MTHKLRVFSDRFERFYIRYDVHETLSIEADVWEVAEWRDDGTPMFFNAGPGCETKGIDPTQNDPLLAVYVKWDGCCHVRMNGAFHFDDLDELDALRRCIGYVYDDLCEKHGVVDG